MMKIISSDSTHCMCHFMLRANIIIILIANHYLKSFRSAFLILLQLRLCDNFI